MATENLYATFCENNLKEREVFYFFLQYNGNERELADLKYIVDKTKNVELYGDNSTFSLDITHLITESAAHQMVELSFGTYSRIFHIYKGKMSFHRFEYDHRDNLEIALKLDQDFYALRIGSLFRSQKEVNYYANLEPFSNEDEFVKQIATTTYYSFSTDNFGIFYHRFTEDEKNTINSFGVLPRIKDIHVKVAELQIFINIHYEEDEKTWMAEEHNGEEDEPLYIRQISNPI